MAENSAIFIFDTELSQSNERIKWRVKLKERAEGK
jgi:hypothetical protein